MPVTLRDLARALSLSISTVNAALYNRSDISSATRKRVQDMAQAMNYHPNLVARSLKTQKTYVLGVIVPDLSRSFFAEVTKGIDAVASAQSYNLLICNTGEDPSREADQMAALISKRVDGLILASAHQPQSKVAPESLEVSGIPLVLVDRFFPATNFVGADDVKIGYLATKHLIERGYRRIAHLRGPNVSTAQGRLNGYLKALREFGIREREEYILEAQFHDESSGFKAAKKLLTIRPRPDAVFAASDPIAIGALEGLLKGGQRVPEDIGLIGVGSHRYGPYLRVPLSTVDQNLVEIGRQAASLLLDLIKKGTNRRKPRVILLDPALIERQSSRGRTSSSRNRGTSDVSEVCPAEIQSSADRRLLS
jgi:LacI family transcriptional regulator